LPDLRVVLAAAWICWLTVGCAAQATRSNLTRAERQEDLNMLAVDFAEREQSFTPRTRDIFEKRLAVLEAGIGSMSQGAFIAGIQWGVAAADNRHTEALADYAVGRDPVMRNAASVLGAVSP
jgi:hypothetical protein